MDQMKVFGAHVIDDDQGISINYEDLGLTHETATPEKIVFALCRKANAAYAETPAAERPKGVSVGYSPQVDVRAETVEHVYTLRFKGPLVQTLELVR